MKTPKKVPHFDIDLFSEDCIKKFESIHDKHTRPSLRLLASNLDVSVATLSRVINYGKMPDIKTLAVLCEWMEINPVRYFPKCHIFSDTNYHF